MQIKDQDNENKNDKPKDHGPNLDDIGHSDLNSGRMGNQHHLNETGGLSSTFKSIDLPPKEYEQQLQQYEAEVRNHIRVQQQLKLHIEVLNERVEEFEKEKEELKQQMNKEFKDKEEKLKEKF